ncbi:MAG: lysophospholipid acyltransferase family protein [Pseudomonadota bacterium]
MSYVTDKDKWLTRATEWVMYASAWSFRFLTWPLNTWTLTRSLAPLGGLAAWMIPAARQRIIENVDHVWPGLTPAEKKIFVKANGAQTLCLFVEYSRLDKVLREVGIQVDGEEHLRERPDGKGAILVTAHFGNWEAVRFAAKSMGQECGIIYRAFNNRFLDRFTLNLIPAAGEPVLQKGTGMRQLFAHVRKGGVVMILVDQRNSGAPYLDFLGKPAETVLAAAELAQRTGAALIPTVAVRDLAGRKFNVTFEEPVTGDDPQKMMQEVNDRIGAWVAEAPDQWFWLHRRWRTTKRSQVQEVEEEMA